MPWLPIYADENDMKEIIEILNKDADIAFIVFDGFGEHKQKWKAIKHLDVFDLKRICIWHIPSGNLVNDTKDDKRFEEIKDPWKGWEEKRTGGMKNVPFFSNDTGIIWFNNWAFNSSESIALSSFEWIGNHYSIIGKSAPEETLKWWNKLKKIISNKSKKIGRTDEMKPEIFCMPEAFKKISSGYQRDINPRISG